MRVARHAYRSFRAAPAVWSAIVVSLAFGTGANFALFSLVNSLMLRPLPVAEPERLVTVSTAADPGTGPGRGPGSGIDAWNYLVFQELQDAALFESVAAWSSKTFDTSPHGRAAVVNGLFVSGSLFPTLGLAPARGRLIGPDDDRRPADAPGEAVAVISHGFWQRRFNGADEVVGQRLLLDRAPFTIVGVMPRGFLGPEVGTEVDVAIPLGAEPLVRQALVRPPGASWLTILGRLRADDARHAAIARLRAFQPLLRERIQRHGPSTSDDRLAEPLDLQAAGRGVSALRTRYQRPLTVLGVVSALVLAIACGNVANLLFARAIARRREMSVRQALGASMPMLVKELMAESAVLIGLGAGSGALLAVWAVRLFVGQVALGGQTASLDLSPDWRVFGFAGAVASLALCASALLPALRAARVDPAEALSHGGRVRGADGHRGVHALLVVQVAFTLVLLVAAGLFVRTLGALVTQPLGLERDKVTVVRVESTAPPPDVAGVLALYDRFQAAARALPGVEHASLSTMTPVGVQTRWLIRYDVPGLPHISAIDEVERTIMANIVSSEFFATFGTRVLLGREFVPQDSASAPPVAVVNQAFVERVFGGASPIGRIVRQVGFVGRPSVDREIVGVVEDAAYLSLREMHLPTMYIPMVQRPAAPPVVYVGIRTSGVAPSAIAESALDAIAAVDPTAALSATTLAQQVNGSLAQERLVAVLSAFFGALALVLAAVGLFGVMSHSVGQRRTELGIRLALGATRAAVVRMIAGRVGMLVAAGVAAGVVMSWWLAPFADALMYGLSSRDSATFAGAIALVSMVGVVAGLIPAFAASRLDPADVLRRD
jgi:putative ABC transport system permease protein